MYWSTVVFTFPVVLMVAVLSYHLGHREGRLSENRKLFKLIDGIFDALPAHDDTYPTSHVHFPAGPLYDQDAS